MTAAADTFRAAAVEQSKVWGERSNVDVTLINQKMPILLLLFLMQLICKKKCWILIVDTAGRLQTKNNLMDELAK